MTRGKISIAALQNLIIDMDGVLYRGNEPIPGVAEFVAFLREQGIGFVLATNNSTRTRQQFVDKLAGMGVSIFPDEVLTSALSTASYMASIAPPGTRAFVVGEIGLRTALRDAGFELVETEAEYVVVGMDFCIGYDRLRDATLQIRAGAQFIGTNPDKTFPSELGIVPGAGSIHAFLEAATGKSPFTIGKPGPAMMEQAMEVMGALPETTAVLGDRLETDILAGQQAGLPTLLVFSGITDRALLEQSEIKPDLLFDDVAHLHATWKGALDD